MNFKIKSLVVLLVISVFLLNSCEVYQTLYGTPPADSSGQVIRVEGSKSNDTSNMAKMLYAAAAPTQHDPFKQGQNPLGPFSKGKPLGFTLEKWLGARGIGIYSVDGDNAGLDLSFKNLVPNGAYTVWCSRITLPPNDNIVDSPCGAEDGSENMFSADAKGNGALSIKLKKLEPSTKEETSLIALAYHSDGKTYGASPGDFGLNSHVQIFFMMPAPSSNSTAFEVPLKFINHMEAGLPEQDVFIEYTQKAESPSGNAAKENEKPQVVEKSAETPKEMMNDTVMINNKEELTVIKSKEKPIVIVVQETDKVNLVPKADDADKNTTLAFTFTSPLNEKGQWQTNYGDAGEYTLTVTVSDGESVTSRDVLVIVNKKEEAPTIESAKPVESGLVVDEGQFIDFSFIASDLNKDPLAYTWKLDGVDMGGGTSYKYTTTYEDAGTHTVKADVSDDVSSASKLWSVNVKNVNRKPILEKIDDIKVKETDKVIITALATDADKDRINYSINDKRFTQEDNAFTWDTDYDSAGVYQITLYASDGQDTVSQTFTVTVENVNRPPVITDIIQKK